MSFFDRKIEKFNPCAPIQYRALQKRDIKLKIIIIDNHSLSLKESIDLGNAFSSADFEVKSNISSTQGMCYEKNQK